jgi:hypothetical protein
MLVGLFKSSLSINLVKRLKYPFAEKKGLNHMNSNGKLIKEKLVGLSAVLGLAVGPACALEGQAPKLSPLPGNQSTPQVTAPVSAVFALLNQAYAEYSASPDDVSFAKYWNLLREQLLIGEFSNLAIEPGAIISAVPSLAHLKVKVIDLGGHSRLWTFPAVRECHSVIYQAPAGRSAILPLPQSITLREARVVGSAVTPNTAKPGVAQPVLARRHLVLIGGDRQSQMVWLKAYNFKDGWLSDTADAFSSLPAFFTQNVLGRASFSGNDIVLTIASPTITNTASEPLEKPAGAVNDTLTKVVHKNATPPGYKVILHYLQGHYVLWGKLPDDGPFSVALNFSQAVALGRPEIAKAWLVDPKLVSIPRYLGILGRMSPPMRLVTMSSPGNYSRYRLVTSLKDDLIIEVATITQPGRWKGRLAVRALFAAPSDPFCAKITGQLVVPQAPQRTEAPPASRAIPQPNRKN